MHSEIMEVIIRGLVANDIERIKRAVTNDWEEDLNWLRDILRSGFSGYEDLDGASLIDEFQSRRLELVAMKRGGDVEKEA
jgi:hypothetical protein